MTLQELKELSSPGSALNVQILENFLEAMLTDPIVRMGTAVLPSRTFTPHS